jgi:hypothetical protein
LHVRARSSTAYRSVHKTVTDCRSDPRGSTDYRSDSELYRLQVRSQEVDRPQVSLRALQLQIRSMGVHRLQERAGQILGAQLPAGQVLKRVRGCGLEPGAPQPAGQTQRSTGCSSDPRRFTDYRSDSELYRLRVRSQEVHILQVRLRALQAAGQFHGGFSIRVLNIKIFLFCRRSESWSCISMRQTISGSNLGKKK